MADLDNAEYTLYSSPFSLYSMMARHTVQLGPTTRGARPPRKVALSFVNHRRNENLREDYLVRVNPRGQVPSMAGDVLERPLTDSVSITLYLAETHYPAMLPPEHAAAIRNLLERIHAIHGLSITNNNPTPGQRERNPSPAEDILKRTDISPEYRKALEDKLKFHNENNAVALQPAVVSKARADLRAILEEVAEHRRQGGASCSDDDEEEEWIFGADVGPTALDSHLLPLVLRLVECGNAELVPRGLRRWAAGAAAGSPSWRRVMRGRPTRYDPSMGPVEDMEEMMSL